MHLLEGTAEGPRTRSGIITPCLVHCRVRIDANTLSSCMTGLPWPLANTAGQRRVVTLRTIIPEQGFVVILTPQAAGSCKFRDMTLSVLRRPSSLTASTTPKFGYKGREGAHRPSQALREAVPCISGSASIDHSSVVQNRISSSVRIYWALEQNHHRPPYTGLYSPIPHQFRLHQQDDNPSPSRVLQNRARRRH
jgi:hypothetical protein